MFADRQDAGHQLGNILLGMDLPNPVILALPRGGVPVAVEIARILNAPVELLHVRKLGVPFQPELAVGAVVDGDHPEWVVNEDIARLAGLSKNDLRALAEEQIGKIERRKARYSTGQAPIELENKSVVVVDDGIATGATVRIALTVLKRKRLKQLILAVPVASSETLDSLRTMADVTVCLSTPASFGSVGMYYRNFRQVSDVEVLKLLTEAYDSRRQIDTRVDR